MSIKLKAIKIFPPYRDMFTPGRVYHAERVSPNNVMALFISDNGGHVNVTIHGSSVYGDFEVIK